MSKIYVSEFGGLGQTDNSDSVNILPIPALAEYTIIVSAGSSGGPLIGPLTKFIEISTDTTCSFAIGTAGGIAGLSNCRLSIGERIVRRVPNVPPIPSVHNQPVAPANFIFTTANA